MGRKKVWKTETGPVIHSDAVGVGKCTFDTSCCWKNGKPPFDHFEWNVIRGRVNPTTFSAHFGKRATLPDSNFLAVVSERTMPSNEAQFYSCSIPCSKTNIVLSLRYWLTRNVRLQVCSREAFSESEDAVLSDCQELSPTASSQVVKIELPITVQQKILEVVIVADNFIEPVGAAIIDDLQIHYQPCEGGQEDKHTGLVDNGECGRVACNFERGNMCAYNELSTSLASGGVQWSAVQGRYHNPNTGLRSAGRTRCLALLPLVYREGRYYAATYLKPRQASTIVTEYYEATHGIQLQACCGDSNCVASYLGIRATDRQWNTADLVCPAGRHTVKFTATNHGKNEGAVALDSIQLYKDSGHVPSLIC
ncbi:unnamed protein product [Soboliphyme baturini]|uniref:MAM domain-containing protein n=1 Tax=Soboliphyme baturini TaxID=241478 RepID=A0A183IXC0_9BILA|nr:unnamed protein product [Soboliphyme baturini]